jgi:Flp pilus assembly protein TadD
MPSTQSERATAIGNRPPRMPATAERLRIPLHSRSQSRLLERWGFDLNAADAPERAEALLAKAASDPDRLLLAAAVRSSRGDDRGALAAAEAAVAEDDRSARAHTTLATLLARSGDAQAAYRHAARAVLLDPEDPVALYNRGVTSWALHDHAGARADFDRVTALLGIDALPWWQRWRRSR